jgi:hypothetical protein
VLARGCLRLSLYLDGFSERGQAARALDESCHAFLEPLIDPDEPLTDVALILLALGIASKRASTAGTATDIARLAIDDGRLDPTALAWAIAQLAATGALTWSRIAARPADIAVVSELHSQVVRETVVALIAQGTPPADADVLRLLQFLHERCIEDGIRIEDAHSRIWLARFTGSGKTAKAAHALLALHPAPDTARAARAATRRDRGRRDRAARWSRLAL